MLGTVVLNMCIKSRKHQSYRVCADELLHITRGLSAPLLLARRGGGSRKQRLHALLFRPTRGVARSPAKMLGVAVAPAAAGLAAGPLTQERQRLRAGGCCCHRRESSSPTLAPAPWERALGSPPADTLPRGVARSPTFCTFFFSTATSIHNAALKEEKKIGSDLVDVLISV